MMPNILCSRTILQLIDGCKLLVVKYQCDCTCHMEFFAIGCLLPLVQGDYNVCNCICLLYLKFCLLQLKL